MRWSFKSPKYWFGSSKYWALKSHTMTPMRLAHIRLDDWDTGRRLPVFGVSMQATVKLKKNLCCSSFGPFCVVLVWGDAGRPVWVWGYPAYGRGLYDWWLYIHFVIPHQGWDADAGTARLYTWFLLRHNDGMTWCVSHHWFFVWRVSTGYLK